MSKCDLRQNKKGEVFCASCEKIYGSLQEIDVASFSPHCSFPSLFQMSKNLLASTAKHIANNATSASKKTQQCRMTICKSCQFLQEDSERCLSCGCYVSIKTSWASESCPEGKWDSEVSGSKSSKGCGCRKKRT